MALYEGAAWGNEVSRGAHELNDGRLMAFGRRNSESEQKAFNFKTPASFSSDGGITWPHKRLVTPGGKERTVNGIDRNQFKLSGTSTEQNGYLAATQTRDGRIQLISSKNHHVFNLAWLKELPDAP